jgi:hypothetical protein
MVDIMPFRLSVYDGPTNLGECPYCGDAVMADEKLIRTWDDAYQHYDCAVEAVTDADALCYAKDNDADRFFALLISCAQGGHSLDNALFEYKPANVGKIAEWKCS